MAIGLCQKLYRLMFFRSGDSCSGSYLLCMNEDSTCDVASGVLFWIAFVAVLIFLYISVPCIIRSTRSTNKPAKVRSTHTYKGLCLSFAMEPRHSMTSSAWLLRQCDRALWAYQKESLLQKALRKMDASLVNSSNNLKLLRPVRFFQSFKIQTRIVWWDQHSLYVEQKLQLDDDDLGMGTTVCAVNFSRQTVDGAYLQEVLDLLPMCSCPPPVPPEISSWVVCINVVNRELQLSCC